MRTRSLLFASFLLTFPAASLAADAKAWDCDNLDPDAMDPTGWKQTAAARRQAVCAMLVPGFLLLWVGVLVCALYVDLTSWRIPS